MIKLSQKFIDALVQEPETGMGYQVADITLKNGRVYKDAIILNSEFISSVRGHDPIPFLTTDIKNIDITHNRFNPP